MTFFMLYIFLSIFCNALLFVILKAYPRFSISSFHAIVINYFTAGTLGFLFAFNQLPNGERIFELSMGAIPLGLLFISVFTLISKTAREISIATASIANKMSVVIPVLSAYFLFNDSMHLSKIAGIALALLAVVITVYKKKEEHSDKDTSVNKKSNWFYPLFVFIGSGVIDAYINYVQKRVLINDAETSIYILLCFYSAGITGIFFTLFSGNQKIKDFNLKNIVGGILLGIPNYFSIYFVMQAINQNVYEGSVIYPIVNVGVVVSSTIFAMLLFKERLSLIQSAGILMAVLAIFLIAF